MNKMRFNILFGGSAGQGPNILTSLVGEALVKQGYYVFYSRDYQSLIRGGHNFNVLTISDERIGSNDSKIDLIVALNEETERIHKKDLSKNGLIIKAGENEENMYFAGAVFKILGVEFKILDEELKRLKKFYEENIKHAKAGYEKEKRSLKLFGCNGKLKSVGRFFLNGSQGTCEGAIASGLDIYYAYPMTPATPLLFELAPRQAAANFLTLELESEIAAAISAMGSAITGAKTMTGTSGGGFDLMTEAFSMAGIAEIPIVFYIASRPGPGTGVATYTGQGDLKLCLNAGHGELFRVVVMPGDSKECYELTNQAFYLSQKYKMPSIILTDKHLAESFYTFENKSKLLPVEKSTKFGRYNSYEHTNSGESTEDAEIIKKGFDRRMKNERDVSIECGKFEGIKVHGNKNSKNVIVSYGSTKGAIIDAIKDTDCKFVQVLYASPFPTEKIKKELSGAKKIILVENSSSGVLGDLIREKTCINIEDKNKILRYDGRPFLGDELKEEIGRKMK
jgi:2-oxoglutarate ferredoxin oxidoreductase subunit alpha